MPHQASGSVALKRFRAVLLLRSKSIAVLARELGITQPHLRFVLLAERKPSERLRRALEVTLNDDEWKFVRGFCDMVPDRGSVFLEEKQTGQEAT